MKNQLFRNGNRTALQALCLLSITIISISIVSWKQRIINPLAQTKWTGTMSIPSEENVVLEFTNDRLNLIFDQQVVEVSAYQIKGDTVTLKKVSGNSPCEMETGSYLYHVSQETLTFKVLNDECSARSQAFSPNGYKQITR